MAMPQEGTNGAASNGTANKLVFVLRLFRLKPGDTAIVRPLTQKVLGCFTHFYQKKSHYCPGADCNAQVHKFDRVWKGYLPILLYLDTSKRWKPEVLEVSENLEVDFRHVLEVGQTWEIFRYPKVAGATSPLQGKLCPDKLQENLPPAFDIMPVVNAIFHRFDIRLDQKNPRPDRVYLSEVEGEMPDSMKPNDAEQDNPLRPQMTFAEMAKKRAESQKGQLNGKKA